MNPDNISKNMHIQFQNDQCMGTLSKIRETERLEERKKNSLAKFGLSSKTHKKTYQA